MTDNSLSYNAAKGAALNDIANDYPEWVSRIRNKDPHEMSAWSKVITKCEKAITKREDNTVERKNNFTFIDLYMYIASKTGFLPLDKIGNALGEFLGFSSNIAAQTKKDMIGRYDWKISLDGSAGLYIATPPVDVISDEEILAELATNDEFMSLARNFFERKK